MEATINVLKFEHQKRKNILNLFLSSPFKKREVTNFAKGGNLIASLCKIGYFPHRMIDIFLFEIKILLFEFLEHLPYFADYDRNGRMIPLLFLVSFLWSFEVGPFNRIQLSWVNEASGAKADGIHEKASGHPQ